MKIYFLRHGERGHGEEQDTLTEIGIEQAKRASKFFKNIKIEKIICGNSNRAKKTAEMILRYVDCKLEYTSQVNEQSLGIFEGKSKKEWDEAVKNSELSEKEFRPLNGENRKDAYDRAKKFIQILKKSNYNSILVISHSGFISDIITLILNFSEEENIHFKTGFSAISYFELDDKNFEVKDFYIGNLTHLGKYK